ncbi:LacI family DNA-binding transcriptional regulator [Pontibacillus sp. HMF3514]|uniref:LacI family DNA-binding transcriptional regulator n=1 Tax=Pontibacillus sp. HMF3514 TaxID=2692425 RepID=UPI00131F5508|nr:LacI family DNA-binding transcriptional regulator [Pontibacillus sp. HMF3514]QHE51705.1 substrate-binding domain-containing protein [Pontibacillus sp. HMF3514]
MKVTIYEVAKEADVSIATVSKVINNTGRISEATRIKVLEAMKALNYYPSVVASALTGKRTDTLGLLIPDISNPFFSEIARNIEDKAHERGISVIMCSTDHDEEKEKKYIELLKRKQVDGFIVASGIKNKGIMKELTEANVPLAMLAQEEPAYDVTVVSVDNYKGGYEATSHLFLNGHRNVGIIAEQMHSNNMRLYAYRDVHEAFGVLINEDNIVKTTATIENGRECTKQLLDKDDPPTAIFACNDLLAIGVIQAAREKGLNIPDDLSVIGFDNTILATTTVPALTTMAQPIEDMGKKIIDVIINKIEGDNERQESIFFNPTLMIRGTTAPLVTASNKVK